MLIWMCALHCEAKPVIDYYRLKKIAHGGGFDYYENDNTLCFVSGLGGINMAAATAWAAAHLQDRQDKCWINLGTGGHPELEPGKTVIASKVSSTESPGALYPVPVIQHPFISTEIISQHHENTHYLDDTLFDMEAFAFLHTASRFTTLELCQCIKVVSDNNVNPLTRNKAQISALIASNMDPITEYASRLDCLAQDYSRQSLPANQFERFSSLAHFTATQQIQLKKVLHGLQTYDASLDKNFNQVKSISQAKKLLAVLHDDLHRRSETL